MSENPDQWYQDALDRKRSAMMRLRLIEWAWPRVLALLAMVFLGVIAWKL